MKNIINSACSRHNTSHKIPKRINNVSSNKLPETALLPSPGPVVPGFGILFHQGFLFDLQQESKVY